MRAKGQSGAPKEQIECVNRARDFFGDDSQRWNNWRTFIGCSKMEQYYSGSAALILDCDVSIVSSTSQVIGSGQLRENIRRFIEGKLLIVLKTDGTETHNLEQRSEKLMLVSDIQPVERPQRTVPSLIGFYGVQNEIMYDQADSSLFESVSEGADKFFPRFSDWKTSPFRSAASTQLDDSMLQEIEGTPEIMQGIANNESTIIERKPRRIYGKDSIVFP
jgi:hypothetical protein